MFITLVSGAILPAPSVSLRALYRSPPNSITTYLVTAAAVRTCAVLSWAPDGGQAVLEGRARSEAVADEPWSEWTVAATLAGDADSYVQELEPGLAFQLRLRRGGEPFSEPTPILSALGEGQTAESIEGCYVPEPARAAAAAAAVDAAPKGGAGSSTMVDDDMPWDSPGAATADAKNARGGREAEAPPQAEHARADEWAPPLQPPPLLAAVPTSAEVALLQAQASLLSAVRSGRRRLRVDLLAPGLNRLIENSHAYSEPLMGFAALHLAEAMQHLRVKVIFPSAGTAAGGEAAFRRALGRDLRSHVSVGAVSGAVTRDAIAEGHDFTARCVSAADPCDAYLVAAPANARGDAVVLAVEQAVEKMPDATWILFNPDLEDTILSYTFGISTSDACRKFVETFEHAYYYRGLFQIQRPSNRPVERGALLHHHDGPWVAHGLCPTAGGYEHLRTFKAAPTRAQLSNLPW